MKVRYRLALRALALASLASALLVAPADAGASHPAADAALDYCDFEQAKDGRPVSTRGGFIQITSYEENATRRAVYKGMANTTPTAPDIVKIKQEDTNHLGAFEYEFLIPNQYAGVQME